MGPKNRAVLVVSLLLTFLWAVHVVWTVLLGSGINFDLYLRGVIVVGSSVAFGFALVWSAATLASLRRNMTTGFEADVTDEFGTGFEMAGADGKSSPFKLSLSKFLPQMVALPSWPGLHPLEAELLGFLQGYRHWPVDLQNQSVNRPVDGGRGFISLYEQAIARWQVMRHLPGTTALHRIAALSKDLAMVHAYREIRTTYPLWQLGRRDQIRFVSRCQAHGGITAFVISTFPAFRAMKETLEGQETQKALLVALRYHLTPTLLPLNGGALARELVDYLWRADAQLRQLDVRDLDQMKPEDIEELKENVREQWLGLLTQLKFNDSFSVEASCLKMSDGSVWLKQSALLSELAPLLKPDLRQTLGLWETGAGIQHPSWPHLANLLLEDGYIANGYDGQAASNGCFSLIQGTQTWGPAVNLLPDPVKHVTAVRAWQMASTLAETPEVVMDGPQLAAHALALAGNVDAKLAELF